MRMEITDANHKVWTLEGDCWNSIRNTGYEDPKLIKSKQWAMSIIKSKLTDIKYRKWFASKNFASKKMCAGYHHCPQDRESEVGFRSLAPQGMLVTTSVYIRLRSRKIPKTYYEIMWKNIPNDTKDKTYGCRPRNAPSIGKRSNDVGKL